jgi:PTS system glucitol/sorbitol-specific IIA component
MIYYRTVVTEIGEEVADLLDGGVLILYAHGVPAALAEVSVMHQVQDEIVGHTPSVGSTIKLGGLQTTVTAIGDSAWHKVKELGHVVINFNASATAERPGEMCVQAIDPVLVKSALVKGCLVVVED